MTSHRLVSLSLYVSLCLSVFLCISLTDIDDCPPQNPCGNGGTCVDGVNQYTCDCETGYTGDHCQDGNVCLPFSGAFRGTITL